MKAIVSGFSTLLTLLKTGFSMLMNVFKGIGYMLVYTNTMFTKLAYLIGQLPGWVNGFMMATLAISILYLIIGRTGGKSD